MDALIALIGPKAFNVFKGGLKKTLGPTRARIKSHTPTDRGILKKHVKLVVRKPFRHESKSVHGLLMTGVVGYIGLPTDADIIAAYTLEFGTQNRPGRRIIKSAIRGDRERIFTEFRKDFTDKIDEALKKNRNKG